MRHKRIDEKTRQFFLSLSLYVGGMGIGGLMIGAVAWTLMYGPIGPAIIAASVATIGGCIALETAMERME